ncbi:hypothetical protein SDRG_08375 [Saprolegnia diclina VS20]|uniref:6-phosphogluconolactonase n=1 Tax=Saprolegnia diclina (strain VS20) TaxID=1156394 RepID=T0RUX8_SAPDV|nr:hypothetical protein SDRG_08375 [Saprolegnia diclina VS20]EQC34167.1 hypothetical protein SDRG_08375 [Saprolegnia diclina VS20]|eukprot:XP_008612479.1 hypothetical protein SDRG_08375 [Saprolegnia diclina VS20]
MRLLLALVLFTVYAAEASPFLFVGSKTNAADPSPIGLTIYSNSNGHLREVLHQSNVTTGNEPTYLTVTQDRRFLYMTNEVDIGHVASFKIDDAGTSLTLTPLGLAPTASHGPVHIAPTKSGWFVLIASYNIGSVTVMQVDANGFADRIAHQVVFSGGSHVVPGRQDGPHAHCVALSPNDDFVFVTDLGNDRIMQFAFDATTGYLTPNAVPYVDVGPGTLPRHMAFHPSGEYLYLTTEASNELKKYAFDPVLGTLTLVASVTTTSATGVLTGAIHVTSSGRFVLVSNRYGAPASDDSIVVYDTDTLAHVGTYRTSTWGGPRDFTITDDDFVYVTNENTNSIDTFQLMPDGELRHLPLSQPRPFHPQVIVPF